MKSFFILITIILTILSIRAKATHIVGGELELIHVDGYNYSLRMIIYFDKFNGNPGALDSLATVRIFRRTDGALMGIHTLVLRDSTDVLYSNPDCAIGILDTDRLFYQVDVTLPPELYNDPGGYEVVWERCCRNNVIDNVFYGLPHQDNTVGQTFILEFPPVVDSQGNQFVNSSPILFPPLRDFACDNELYYVDFAGIDLDGDSIAYSLSTPLNSTTADALPPPTPAPHRLIQWASGFTEENMIPGSPKLMISNRGLVTVTPNMAGLFVFAVKAEEFRDGAKIGEVRRDFQMLVLDCPDPGNAPQVQARSPQTNLFLKDLDTIRFAIEDEKCLNFFVQDMDGGETVNLKALPVNFAGQIDSIFAINQGFLSSEFDTLNVEICIPDCPFLENELAIIDLVGLDDSCPLPLQDTLRLVFDVEAPANQDPFFTNQNRIYTYNIGEGEIIELSMTGIDQDGDTLIFETFTDGFTLEDYGIQVDTIEESPGEVKTRLFWDTDCQVWDFSERTSFNMLFTLNDKDRCNFVGNPDTIEVRIDVELPPNTDPVVSSDLAQTQVVYHLEEVVRFDVFANDADNDLVSLIAVSYDSGFDTLGISFNQVEGQGNVSSTFEWNLGCNPELSEQGEFSIFFIAEDFDKCKLPNSDTLEVNVTILPPENDKPLVGVSNQINLEFDYQVGQMVDLEIFGRDGDSDDQLILELVDWDSAATGFEFVNVAGVGFISSFFGWEINCSHLTEDAGPKAYSFQFIVRDDDCVLPLGDTMALTLTVQDIDSNPDIALPPNVFTPNGDDINDVYFISELPANNCVNQFRFIRVYNRWGRLVFEDNIRDFIWDGGGHSSGVYYYHVEYNNFEFRGIVSIRD